MILQESNCRRKQDVQFKIHDDEYVYDVRHGDVPYVHVHKNLMVFEGLYGQCLQGKDEKVSRLYEGIR